MIQNVPAINADYLAEDLLSDDLAAARAYREARHSKATMRAYSASVRSYVHWCGRRGLVPFPIRDHQLAAFISCEADLGRKPATLAMRIAALRHAAKEKNGGVCELTVTNQVLQGVRRKKGVRQKQAKPITPGLLKAMCKSLDLTTLTGLRDKALLLIGFAGAFRRSELAVIGHEDIEFVEGRGLIFTVDKSKSDQEGRGETVAIPQGSDPAFCPVTALRAWLDAANIFSGPVFRKISVPPSRAYRGPVTSGEYVGKKAITSATVANIVKRHAGTVGENPADYSGHSLRAGFATSAASAGKSLHQIKAQTRHKNDRDAGRYIRMAQAFDEHALEGVL